MEPTLRVRLVANMINLSTPLGLLVARIGARGVSRGPRGLHLADGYRPQFPYAGAFTVGNVVIARGSWQDLMVSDPDLARHEEAHSWQWAALGPLFLPAYTAAMAWSWLRTGDRASANWFEVRAGLALGGYVQRPVRPIGEGLTTLARTVTARLRGAGG